MTDKEKLIDLLRGFNVPHEIDQEGMATVVTVIDTDEGIFEGYAGFFFFFKFDGDGKFKVCGAAE